MDDEAVFLESNLLIELVKDNSTGARVVINRSEELLSLRYNQEIIESEVFDSNSQIDKFYASSSLGQKAPESAKICGTYTSEGLFFDDSKFCLHKLKLKEIGERWKINSTKKINDAKYLTSLYFQDKFPQVEKTISISIPKGIEVEILEFNFADFQITKTEKNDGANKLVTYTAKDLPGMKSENMERGIQYNHPHLLVLVKSSEISGKTINILSSPQDLYAWYSSLTEKLTPNPAVYQAIVQQLIADKKTDQEKIEAIYYWIQDNIRYIAFEDGLAAFKPDEAQGVFEKRYGDCKGMANLAKEMLKSAGFDARLTWIGTKRIMYDHSIPSLGINNHMICTVFLNGKSYYLDPTEKYIPFGENAERIQDRPVMIEDGQKFIAQKITSTDISHHTDFRKLTATINGENLEGSYNINLKGESKKDFLYYYHYTKTDKQQEFLTSFLGNGNSNMKSTNLQLPDLEKRKGDLSIACDLVLSGAVSAFNDEVYVDIDPLKFYKNLEIKETRQGDLDFGTKVNKKTFVELIIPKGYIVSYLPENLSIEDENFVFSIEYKVSDDKIIYTKELSVLDGIIPKQSFNTWNAAIKKLAAAYENQIILKK